MKTIIVNIKNQTVTTNGQTCNFQEAGLNENFGKFNPLTDKDDIEEVLMDHNEGEEIEIIFDEDITDGLKLGTEKEITFKQANELLKNTHNWYDFNNLNKSTITEMDDNIGFEVVVDRSYYIKKVGKKGSIINKNSESEEKAKNGDI